MNLEILQETLVRGNPIKQFARQVVGRGRVHAKESAHPPKCSVDWSSGTETTGRSVPFADGLSDFLGRDPRFGDRVDRRAGGSALSVSRTSRAASRR